MKLSQQWVTKTQKKTFEVKLYNLNPQEHLIDMVSIEPSYLPYITRSFEVKQGLFLKDGKPREINDFG